MRILVLGYFGYEKERFDGQTVKTRNIYRLLSEHCDAVDYFDTQRFKTCKLSALTMLYKFCRADKVFYLPAHGNLKYIFPVLFVLSRICRTEINYVQIGGWLHTYLKSKPLHVRFLSRIKNVFAETHYMKETLVSEYGLGNIAVLNNFRLDKVEPQATHEEGGLRCVFMARVVKEKGLDMMFALADYVQSRQLNVTFDFYGQINELDRMYFLEGIRTHATMAYKGVLKPEEINRTLQHYDLLILPTHYYTEGFPGSVLEAYMSGLPVIVTEWLHAREFVSDGQTGFIVDFENGQQRLNECVELLFEHPEILSQMKKNVCEKSRCYSSDVVWNILRDRAGLAADKN